MIIARTIHSTKDRMLHNNHYLVLNNRKIFLIRQSNFDPLLMDHGSRLYRVFFFVEHLVSC